MLSQQEKRGATKKSPASGDIFSFEMSDDGAGDLLSRDRVRTTADLKIGLVAASYFEYYRMYDQLREQVEADAKIVYDRLAAGHDVVSPPIVSTLDSADEAGRQLREAGIDLLILAYRTYIPDAYIHQLLSHLPDVPILFFASQARDRFDFEDDYVGVLRNSGIMAQVQLVAGFRKMGMYQRIECVAGSIHDKEAYRRIERYIDVVTIYKRLRTMTFGVIGNVFRGMFDFEYDKTKIKGALGPEVLSIQADHLERQWDKAPLDDPAVQDVLPRSAGFRNQGRRST